jgi:hypothetical protein
MLNILLIFFLFLIVYLLNFYFFGAKLLFKSSFEEGTFLLAPNRKDSVIWWQDIKCAKGSWPIRLQGEEGSFQMIVKSDNIDDYIENRIERVIGRDGKETNALHQIIKKKEFDWTQNPYRIDTNNKEQKKLYFRYSLKYPHNLSTLLGEDGWLTFCEFKTTSDYRLAYYIYRDKSSKLYWYAHGDNVVMKNTSYKEYWSKENRTVAVPVGEWFDVEIFWNRSSKDDGRFWLAIDGEIVIDYRGVSKLKDPIQVIMLFTNYASVPLEQWVDNIEVWSDFPCGRGKSCYVKKVN